MKMQTNAIKTCVPFVSKMALWGGAVTPIAGTHLVAGVVVRANCDTNDGNNDCTVVRQQVWQARGRSRH